MNTTENNKIIAEFMGRNGKINKSLYTWKGIDKLLTGGWIPVEQMKFHSDWNWLMEVVEKISEYRLVYPNKANKVCDLKVVINKDALYNSCVEFIKWYNLNK